MSNLVTVPAITGAGATGTAVQPKEHGYGRQGIWHYLPTDDCSYTQVDLEGSEDGTSYSIVASVTDGDQPAMTLVAIKAYMRLKGTGGGAGEAASSITF